MLASVWCHQVIINTFSPLLASRSLQKTKKALNLKKERQLKLEAHSFLPKNKKQYKN